MDRVESTVSYCCFSSSKIVLCFMMVSVWNWGGYKCNNCEMPSFLNPNRNPQAISLLWKCRHVSHSHWKNSSPLAKTKTTDGLLLQTCTLPIAFGHEKRKSRHVGICPHWWFFWFLIWVALSVSSVSVVCYLSSRAFEQTSFTLLSSRWRDGDKNLN